MLKCLLPALTAVCIGAAATNAGAFILDNPDDQAIELLARYLANDTPNFEERARNHATYRQANEFDRPQVLRRLEAQLQEQFGNNRDIDGIQIVANDQFSEYDAERQLFLIDLFSPGSYFPFGQYALLMDNAAAFHEWRVPVERAREIRQASPHGSIKVELILKPFGVSPTNPKEVRTQIVSAKIYAPTTSRLLAELTADPSQLREMAVAGAAGSKPIDPGKHNLLDLTIGMGKAEFVSAVQAKGFKVGDGTNLGEVRFATNQFAIDYRYNSAAARRARASGSTNADRLEPNLFGTKLDCRTQDDRIESCGLAYFDENGKLGSLSYLQSAVDAPKQALVSALSGKYGPPSDRFDTFLWGEFRTEQYVWGSSTEGRHKTAKDFTPLSGPKHWQVEAFVVEPTGQRKVVIVQINDVPAPTVSSGGGSGIKF